MEKPSPLATTFVVLAMAVIATCGDIDYRETYPDRCPMGFDWSGRPSRLCVPNAVGPKLWTATYEMARSTIMMPCNSSGYYDAIVASRYGVVDFDWSNGKARWANVRPMDCEERLVEQAKHVKALNKGTRVWVYRNLVKALPWYSSVREKLCDPNYAGWFLKFDPKVPKPHVPKCDNNYDPPKCSEFYHDQEQTPGHPHGDGNCVQFPCDCGCVPCGEYLWDHRNQSPRKWLVEVHLTGDTALDNPNIDGIFTDDEWNSPGGPTEVDAQSVEDMGLSSKDVADITANWVLSMKAAHTKVLEKGGFAWRMFSPGILPICSPSHRPR